MFTPTRRWQKFCCVEHRDEFHFKTETFSKVRAEMEKMLAVAERRIWLQLETEPPPALIDRLATLVQERILKSREKVGR